MTAKPAEHLYDFRAVTEADLPMLCAWLAEPHNKERWDEGPEASRAEIVEAMESGESKTPNVELDGRPIAYVQSYAPHLENEHPYQDQPFGTLGMDISIDPPDLL